MPAVAAHPETFDGVIPVTMAGLHVPGVPAFAPSAATGTATQTWHVAIPGGTLQAMTSTRAHLLISLLPLIVPGQSISGIHLGETYATLRRTASRYGGATNSPQGLELQGEHRDTWSLEVHIRYRGTNGDTLVEEVTVSAPVAGAHVGGVANTRRRRPPALRVIVARASIGFRGS